MFSVIENGLILGYPLMEVKSGFCYIDAVAITIELFNRS